MRGRRPLPPPPPRLLPASETDRAPSRRSRRFGERFRYLGGNRELFVGGGLLLGFVAAALFALLGFRGRLGLLPLDASLVGSYPAGAPSWAHPLGITHVSTGGTDELLALIRATPFDLAILAGILGGAALLGLLLGGLAGAREGRAVDVVVTFFSDLLAGVPPFLLAVILLANLQVFLRPEGYLPAFVLLYLAILWPTYARLVRARAREVSTRPFVEAAEAAGARPARILRRHILPNSFAPVLAQMPVDVAGVFFVLTVFPFLACFGASGLPTDTVYPLLTPLPNQAFPEWGYLLAQGTCAGWSALGPSAWWMFVFPAAAIALFGVAVALACDGVEKYLARAYAG